MHELSLASNLIKSVTDIAKKEQINIIESITISLGVLSGVDKESLEFCFPIASKNSLLEKSKIIINEIPLKIYCPKCQKETSPDKFEIFCLICHNDDVEIKEGKEFKIVSLETK